MKICASTYSSNMIIKVEKLIECDTVIHLLGARAVLRPLQRMRTQWAPHFHRPRAYHNYSYYHGDHRRENDSLAPYDLLTSLQKSSAAVNGNTGRTWHHTTALSTWMKAQQRGIPVPGQRGYVPTGYALVSMPQGAA